MSGGYQKLVKQQLKRQKVTVVLPTSRKTKKNKK